ncbi:MAG: hypothetical protein M1831_003276 [Alyxoria varia]|nr:MAG: hypothetical protein M1831_003276 [Alyxoria varia]
MSSAQATTAPRKSFAQVAAAAHKPAAPAVKPTASGSEANQTQTKPSLETQVAIPVIRNGIQSQKTSPAPQSEPKGPNQLDEPMKSLGLQDQAVQGPTLDNMAKKDNSDTKSVTSRTTMTLDEKESLRPDDSASMKAGAEEEPSSPSESQAINSKPAVNPDARAFRDQLHEIDRAEASRMLAQRSAEGSFHQPPAQPNGAEACQQYPVPQPHATPQPNYQTEYERPSIPAPDFFLPPDEKLLEALAKPADRLFVLKIEQDLIDFIKDSKENELRLPQTNAFYRLLAHKLAEYYFLGHLLDEPAMSIRIFRLPATRLPPSLLDSVPKSHNTTPPPPTPARKIMRRGDGSSQPNLGEWQTQRSNQNSEYDSKATSAEGSRVGSEEARAGENSAKDKAQMSREERENRYYLTRARIWQEHDEKAPDTSGDNSNQNDEESRESSVSGAKKARKGRRPKDDSFEARSAYSHVNGQSYVANVFPQSPSQGVYVNNNASFGQFEPMGQPLQSASHHMNMNGSSQPQQQYYAGGVPWQEQYQHNYGMQHNAMGGNQYAPGGYDVSNGYQHNPQNMASQSTPRAQAPGLAPSNFQNFQSQASHHWNQLSYSAPYPYYGPSNGLDYSVPSNGQYMHPPTFGAQPMYPMDPNYQSIPSAHALQFNPRSNSFVPRSQAYGSDPVNGNFVPHGLPWPGTPPSQRLQPHSSPGAQTSPSRSSLQNWNPQQQRSGKLQAGNGHSSSIAKWGTPSTLPAKPPPPASSLNFAVPNNTQGQQPLPSHPSTSNDKSPTKDHGGRSAEARADAHDRFSKHAGTS